VQRVTVKSDSNRIVILNTGKDLLFDSTKFSTISCKNIKLKNTSAFNHTIESVYCYYNTEFSVPQGQLPLFIPAGEERELEVCFYPAKSGIRRDTLLIDDNCSPHKMALEGIGSENDFSGFSKCNSNIIAHSVGLLRNYYFQTYDPYPVPAITFVAIPFDRFRDKEKNPNIQCKLFDVLGEFITEGTEKLTKTQVNNYGIFEMGEFFVNTSGLQPGIYFISISHDNDKKVYEILIK
jgi:hypothetical protein